MARLPADYAPPRKSLRYSCEELRNWELTLQNYDVETSCSASTVFFTVGRFIMRSCHAV